MKMIDGRGEEILEPTAKAIFKTFKESTKIVLQAFLKFVFQVVKENI